MLSGPHYNDFILEVIACSIEDAVEAEKGGANRLEVIRDLEAGGFTPPLDLVREICDKVSLPLRVMLREERGFALTQKGTMEKLCGVANDLNGLKVEGVVLGFLDGTAVNVELTKKILSFAPDLKATFHHAFEETGDKLAAISEIKQIRNVDTILSHGGFGAQAERVENLAAYSAAAAPNISVLAGGRIDIAMIKAIGEATGIREFHVGRAARENGRVSASRVAALVSAAFQAKSRQLELS